MNTKPEHEKQKTGECEEPDSNRRTPAGIGPEPIAFDLARRSSRLYTLCMKLHKDKGQPPFTGVVPVQGSLHLPLTELVSPDLS